MTRTARGRRAHSGNPQPRAHASRSTRDKVDPADTGSDDGNRTSFWHTLLHNRSVRSRVAALVLVPLLGTLVLGALFFRNSLDDASAAADVERLASVGVAATDLLHSVQDERDVTALSEANATGVGAVASARDATDAAVTAFQSELDSIRGDGGVSESVVAAFDREIAELDTYRAQRDAGDPPFDAGGAAAYHDVAEAVRGVVTASSAVVHDGETARLIGGLDNVSQAVESASMQRALVTFHLTPNEEPSSALITSATVYQGEQNLLIDRFLAGFDGSGEATTYADRIAAADELITPALTEIRESESVAQSHEQWYTTATERLDVLREIEGEAAATVVENASDAAGSARMAAVFSAIAVAAVLALTIFLAVVVARSIIGPLRRLRGAAQQTAKEDLPAFVERLHRDGPTAATAQGPSGSGGVIAAEGNDEIGEVAKSFNDVHAMAVRIAADQALLRQNLDTIVVNLSRRTQSLIDRQLGEIESLEQRERDPDQLSALFRIDHMATRVRRHAESLLVLAGVEEMRTHSSSAPVLDLVRAAAGEVEQYPRVKFGVMPTDLVSAAAVDDITHMLAELIDNATEFSAPSTPVRVTSQPLLGGGLRIQVSDAGLGIPADQLDELNGRLADVSDIDVATSRTLGLYVVARLSAKHGIKVRLEPGSGGGTVAQVDLPANLIHSPLDADLGTSSPASRSAPDPLGATDPLNASSPWPSAAPTYPPEPRSPAPTYPPEPRSPAPTYPAEPRSPAPTYPAEPRSPAPTYSPEPRSPSPATPLAGTTTSGYQPAPSQSATQPVATTPSFLDEPARSDTTDIPLPGSPESTSESPIYESVRSAWFSGDKSSDWSSPADAGWRRAAEVLRSAEEAATARWNQPPSPPPSPAASPAPSPTTSMPLPPPAPPRTDRTAGLGSGWAASAPPPPAARRTAPVGSMESKASEASAEAAPSPQAETTQVSASGLPVRRRGASLVPGSIGDPAGGAGARRRPTAPTKSADSVSSTLASLQRGVGRGRQEAGGWVPKRPSDPERSKQ